jgi:GLPGLI family protein
MKKIFFILFILNQFCLAQIKNGIVQYGVIKRELNFDSGDKMFDITNKQIDREVKNISQGLLFDLKFNEQESSFILNKDNIVLKEGQDLSMLLGWLVNYPNCYSNYKTGEFRNLLEYERTGKIVVSETQKYDWTLINETKVINGTTCYKATSPYYVEDRAFTDEISKVTAWYSLKHPVPYGPNGYNNLPGLIMEITTKFCTLYVKKMDFNLKEVEIEKLNSGKILTKNEFYEVFMSTMPPDNKKTMEEDLKNNTNQKKELEKVK